MRYFRWFLGAIVVTFFVLHWNFFKDTLYFYYKDLCEVATTYIKFHSVKNVKFRFPKDAKLANATSHQLVPKIMHQIWLEEHNNQNFSSYTTARNTCITLHKSEEGWQHWLWTDDVATRWVNTQYPHLSENYTSYGQTIQRSNILRYLILYHYGGIYLDLDITCRRPLNNLLHVPFLTSATSKLPVAVNNAFILARPRHHLLEHLINDRIIQHNRSWPSPWFETMITTGYLFLSNTWMEYLRQHKHLQHEDAVFVLADGHGRYKNHALGGRVTTPLFKHAGTRAWHGLDAQIFTWVEEHGILVSTALLFIVLAWFTWMVFAICGCPLPRRQRARKAMRAQNHAFMMKSRMDRADGIRRYEEEQHNASKNPRTAPGPSTNDNIPTHDEILRFIHDMMRRPSQGASCARAASVHNYDNYDSVGLPIAIPNRTASIPSSYTRTSSMMPRTRFKAVDQSSIYDFAYN